jgi:hypothetical protein
MVDASLPAQIAAIENMIMNRLREDPTGQNWRLQLGGDQWSVVLEALRRYQAESLKSSAPTSSPIDGTAP